MRYAFQTCDLCRNQNTPACPNPSPRASDPNTCPTFDAARVMAGEKFKAELRAKPPSFEELADWLKGRY